MPQNQQPENNYNCECCGRIGFVYVEELGKYLCRDRYLKFNKEQLDRAARFAKGATMKKIVLLFILWLGSMASGIGISQPAIMIPGVNCDANVFDVNGVMLKIRESNLKPDWDKIQNKPTVYPPDLNGVDPNTYLRDSNQFASAEHNHDSNYLSSNSVAADINQNNIDNWNHLLDSNLVVWWGFDCNNFDTNVPDNSGHGHNGTSVSYTCDMATVGMIGGALDFNGVNDRVDAGWTLQEIMRDSFTITLLAKSDDGNPPETVDFCGKEDTEPSESFAFGIDVEGKLYAYYYYLSAGGGTSENEASFTNGAQPWTMATMVMTKLSSSTARISLYINGELRKTSAILNVAMATYTSELNLFFGGCNVEGALDGKYAGSLDDIRIYNKALSANEILAIYNSIYAAYHAKQTGNPHNTNYTEISGDKPEIMDMNNYQSAGIYEKPLTIIGEVVTREGNTVDVNTNKVNFNTLDPNRHRRHFIKVLKNDFSMSSETPIDVCDLIVNVEVGKTYIYNAVIFMEPAAYGGWRLGIGGTCGGGGTDNKYEATFYVDDPSFLLIVKYLTGLGNYIEDYGQGIHYFTLQGSVTVGADGTVSVIFSRKNPDDYPSVIKIGSYFEVKEAN